MVLEVGDISVQPGSEADFAAAYRSRPGRSSPTAPGCRSVRMTRASRRRPGSSCWSSGTRSRPTSSFRQTERFAAMARRRSGRTSPSRRTSSTSPTSSRCASIPRSPTRSPPGAPVVALESTIISHGLPRPDNARIAREIEAAVRAAGAVPATIAVVDGVARIGLDDAALARIAESPDVVKASVRDLAVVGGRRGDGATTVAATAHLAARAGIAVFATGGLGGVHRGARETWDESADLTTLGRTRILVVCAGVKSILDVPATLERLETLNIACSATAPTPSPASIWPTRATRCRGASSRRPRSPRSCAPARELGTERLRHPARQPDRAADQLDPALHDRTLADGLAAAAAAGVTRQGRHAVPARLLQRAHRRRGAGGQRRPGAEQRPAGRRGRRRIRARLVAARVDRALARPPAVVCLGDVMVDIVATLPGPLALGSDVHAPIRYVRGGSAANTAAWLAAIGAHGRP